MKPLFVLWTLCLSVFFAPACDRAVEVYRLNNRETSVSFTADRDFLWLPVEDGAPNAILSFSIGDRTIRNIRVALARERADYTVPFDLRPYRDREIVCRVSDCPYDAVCWELLCLRDQVPEPAEDPYRPLFHHAPSYGWMNDPNGMVYENGTYHLFYQYNPYGNRWENMSWGHAVSRDLVNWEECGVVLEPDSLGAVFSGCCVLDPDNTAGFGKDAMIAIYTAAGARQTQCLAYSVDGGKTFSRYAGNPVLTSERADFRDPKVFYHDRTGRWVMILAAGQALDIYSSPDLRTWHFESRFGEAYGAHDGVWECPDLFPLGVMGEPGHSRWVILCSLGVEDGSRVQYFVGDFDGKTFTPEQAPSTVNWMDFGRDHYATVSWNGLPEGRRIALGWMNNWKYANEVPSVAYRGCNTLPRDLALKRTDDGLVLVAAPARELEEAFVTTSVLPELSVAAEQNITPELTAGTGRIEMELDGDGAEVFGFKLFNCRGEYVDVCINRVEGMMYVDRSHAGRSDFSPYFATTRPVPLSRSAVHSFSLWLDRASLEIFVDGGEATVTNLIYPTEPYDRMNFYAKGGLMYVRNLKTSVLKTGNNDDEKYE